MTHTLRTALERISRHRPILGSTGDYREGQLHALEAVKAIADEALAHPEPAGEVTDEELAPFFSERCITLGPNNDKVLLEGDFYAAVRNLLHHPQPPQPVAP